MQLLWRMQGWLGNCMGNTTSVATADCIDMEVMRKFGFVLFCFLMGHSYIKQGFVLLF